MKTIAQYIKDFDDDNLNVRWNAFRQLCEIGSSVVPELIPYLGDSRHRVRFFIVIALGRMGPAALYTGPALIPLLSDSCAYIRCGTAWTLSEIEYADDGRVPALVKALNDVDASVRRYASQALKKIAPNLVGLIT